MGKGRKNNVKGDGEDYQSDAVGGDYNPPEEGGRGGENKGPKRKHPPPWGPNYGSPKKREGGRH